MTTKFMLGKLSNKYFLAFIFSGLVILGFAPFYLFVASGVGVAGLFFLLDNKCQNRAQYLATSFIFGFGYFLFGIYWIAISLTVDLASFGWMIPFALTLIPAALALYFMLLGYGYYYFTKKFPNFNLYQRAILFALLWVFTEILRSVLFTGFPWNLLGYVWLFNINFVQIANIFGVFALSLLFILAALAIFILASKPKILGDKIFVISVFVVVFLQFFYGFFYIKNNKLKYLDLNLRIVQANIKQDMKWDEFLRFKNLQKHQDLTKNPGLENIDLIIWSESSLPYALNIDNEKLLSLLQESMTDKSKLITGAIRFELEKNNGQINIKQAYNSVGVFSKNKILDIYDKHHLVPFGEYVPLQEYLPFIKKITNGSVGFDKGLGPQTLNLGQASISPLICYEAIFLDKIIDKNNIPDLLVNLTNDAWFGNSIGPFQHLDITRLRAVEYGISLVRVANSGISAYVDPFGQIIDKILLNQSGILDVKAISRLDETLFLRHSHLFFAIIFISLTLLCFVTKRKK